MRSNKGVAISTILYMLVIVFGVVLVSFMSVLVNDNSMNRSIIDTIKQSLGVGNLSELDVNVAKEYRYIQAGGTYSSWESYTNITDVDESVSITTIPNMGSMKSRYDLTATSVGLEIVDGVGYLDFNGTTSKGDGVTTSSGPIINTLFINGVYNAVGDMFISFNNTGAFLYNTDLDLSGPDGTYRTQMDTNVTAGVQFKAILVWGADDAIFDIYVDGVKKTSILSSGASHALPFEYNKIALGYGEYATNYYLNGEIYDLRLSSKKITESEAISITAGEVEISDVLDSSNSEVIYGDFIEFREVIEDTTPSTIARPVQNVVYARYVRDYLNGSSSNIGDHWVELEANTYFDEGDIFHGVTVGGTYTETFTINANPDGSPNDGEIRVPAGTYTSPLNADYVRATDEVIYSNFETAGVVEVGFIMFVGSHPEDFSSFGGVISSTVGSDLFIPTMYVNGSWYYDNNSVTWVAFTPTSNDFIVGFMEKETLDLGISNMGLCAYPFIYNVALGKTASGSVPEYAPRPYSRIVDGDITMTEYTEPLVNGIQYVEVDLGAEYPIKDVTSMHYADGRSYYDTVTELYSNGHTSKSIINNYLIDGLYKEIGIGATFQVAEQEQGTEDETAPIATSAPDLAAADDTGTSSTDNKTKNKNALTMSGTGAEAYATVYLYNGSTEIATTTVSSTGTWSKDITLAENASHPITTKVKDAAGNFSASSSATTIIVDTTNPAINATASSSSYVDCLTISISSVSDSGGSGLYSSTSAPGGCVTSSQTFYAEDYAGNISSDVITVTGRSEYRYRDEYFEMDGNDYLRTSYASVYGIYMADGGDYTFEVGLEFTSLAANFYVMDFSYDGDPRFALWYRASSGKIVLYSKRGGTTYINYEYNFSPATNTYYWFKLQGGSDADRGYELYVNGVSKGKSGSSYRYADSNMHTYIGSRYTATELMRGKLHWFRFDGRDAGVSDVNNYYRKEKLSSASIYWYGYNNAAADYRFYMSGTGASEAKVVYGSWSTTSPSVANYRYLSRWIETKTTYAGTG